MASLARRPKAIRAAALSIQVIERPLAKLEPLERFDVRNGRLYGINQLS